MAESAGGVGVGVRAHRLVYPVVERRVMRDEDDVWPPVRRIRLRRRERPLQPRPLRLKEQTATPTVKKTQEK